MLVAGIHLAAQLLRVDALQCLPLLGVLLAQAVYFLESRVGLVQQVHFGLYAEQGDERRVFRRAQAGHQSLDFSRFLHVGVAVGRVVGCDDRSQLCRSPVFLVVDGALVGLDEVQHHHQAVVAPRVGVGQQLRVALRRGAVDDGRLLLQQGGIQRGLRLYVQRGGGGLDDVAVRLVVELHVGTAGKAGEPNG